MACSVLSCSCWRKPHTSWKSFFMVCTTKEASDSWRLDVNISGLYTALFCCCVYLLAKSKKRQHVPLLLVAIVMFGLATADVATKMQYLCGNNDKESLVYRDYLYNISEWVTSPLSLNPSCADTTCRVSSLMDYWLAQHLLFVTALQVLPYDIRSLGCSSYGIAGS